MLIRKIWLLFVLFILVGFSSEQLQEELQGKGYEASDAGLKQAIENNDLEVVEVFFKNGYLKFTDGEQTLIPTLVYTGTPETLSLFLEYQKLTQADSYNKLLYLLIKMDKAEMAEVVVEYIDNPDFVLSEISKLTLLHESAEQGMIEVAKGLIDKGADPGKLTAAHNLPVMVALDSSNSDVYKYLLNTTDFCSVDPLGIENFLRALIRSDDTLTNLNDAIDSNSCLNNTRTMHILEGIGLKSGNAEVLRYVESKFD